nr:transporter substrate-binding domain-containing protein [uncultured Pseudomonas sp.]
MRIPFCLLLCSALFCGPSTAQDAPAPLAPLVKVGYYEFPPYTYTDAEGRPQGATLDLIERLLDKAGYRGEFRGLPGARLYAGLRDGSVHLWPGATGKEELRAHVLESRSVLGELDLALYRRPDMPAPTLPEDLAGHGVIAISGYTYWKPYSDWLQDPALNLRIHRTGSHGAALEMLQRHRGDFLLDYHIPVEQARRQLGIAPMPHQILQRLTAKMIISKKAPNAEALRDALDRAYERLRADGEDLRLQ